MGIRRFTKQPADRLDYDFDFAEWFADRPDVIASYVVTADAGITLVSDAKNGLVVKVVVGGGTTGTSYKVTVRITTDTSLIKEVEASIRVRET